MNNRDKNIVGQILAKTYRIERFLGAGTCAKKSAEQPAEDSEEESCAESACDPFSARLQRQRRHGLPSQIVENELLRGNVYV